MHTPPSPPSQHTHQSFDPVQSNTPRTRRRSPSASSAAVKAGRTVAPSIANWLGGDDGLALWWGGASRGDSIGMDRPIACRVWVCGWRIESVDGQSISQSRSIDQSIDGSIDQSINQHDARVDQAISRKRRRRGGPRAIWALAWGRVPSTHRVVELASTIPNKEGPPR